MIHHAPHKHAVLIPEHMAAHIPDSEFPRYQRKGGYLIVPDDLATMRRLSQYGLRAPSRMRGDYHWKSKYESPLDHQYIVAEFLVNNPRCFNFCDIGTCKTLSTLWAADYLQSIGAMGRVLISSTLSTLDRVWEKHIWENFPGKTFKVIYGPREKRIKLLSEKADFYIINHNGSGVLTEWIERPDGSVAITGTEFDDRPDITHVIVDEGAVLRNSKTDLWKVHQKICGEGSGRGVWWLTGSPMPKAPTDVWGQAKIVNPKTVDQYFSWFREKVMYQKGPYQWLPKKGWEDYVYSTIQPAIRFTRDQCLDLPPCVTEERSAEMSKEQGKAYSQMQTKFVIELESGEITAANEGVKISKLLQLATGSIYDGVGVTTDFDCRPKQKALLESVEAAGNKCLVFTPFKHSIKMLDKFLKKKFSVGVVNGDVSPKKRNEIFRDFQDSDLQIILAHPKAMAHGLDLYAAHTIIWWAPVDDYEIYEQANGRITRPGQTCKQTIIHLVCSGVEQKIYTRLKNKEKMQGILLELLNEK